MKSRQKRWRSSPSTLLILLLVIAVAVVSIFAYTSAKKTKIQEEKINKLSKKVKELAPLDGQEKLSYQKLYPDMKVAKPDSWKTTKKAVYLTFDDGPSTITPRVLEILKNENVKATFFVIGIDSDHDLMKQIVDEGHAIGVHTYSHEYKNIYKSVDSYVKDFYKIYKLIKDKTGVTPTVYRYPGGSNNVFNTLNQDKTTSEMFRRGFVPYDWNVDSTDASGNNISTGQIKSNAVKGIGMDRAIVLMHDAAAKSTTADALPSIIKEYRSAGYAFEVLTNKDAPILFSSPDGEMYNGPY